MSPDSSSDERDPVERLAEEFVARHRSGEAPSAAEYAERHPQWADRIHALFPALLLMERHKIGIGNSSGESLGPGPSAPPLERLGDYRIIREVGRGGMAVVYEAEQESLGRHVALKVLLRYSPLDPRHAARFRREARAAARLHHTNIVPVFGVGEQDGILYYVMQFIPGQGLDEVLREIRRLRRQGLGPGSFVEKRSRQRDDVSVLASATEIAEGLLTGRFSAADSGQPDRRNDERSPSEADLPQNRVENGSPSVVSRPPEKPSAPSADGSSPLLVGGRPDTSNLSGPSRSYAMGVAGIGVQVADALQYAHGQGVLHRDIKPSNLLLDLHGTVWVADFGLAKLADQEGLTHSGDVVGTWRYIAPERFRGESDARSDVYSLGLTLYELLTIQPAFDGATREELIRQVGFATPPRPRKVNPEVPRDLETIVLKAIDRDPSARYQSAGELADELRRFLDGRPPQARRCGPAERLWRWARRNPAVASLGASVLLLLATLAIGSTLAAFWLNAERKQAVGNLWSAYMAQADAGRSSRQAGQRFTSLDVLAKAAKIRITDDLRNEAIACLALVDLRPLRHLATLPHEDDGFAVDPDMERYAIGDSEGNVRLHRLSDGREIARFPRGLGPNRHLDFSPDGRYLVAGYAYSRDWVYDLWDTGRDGPPRKVMERVENSIYFSADGRRMATRLSETEIGLFDPATGAPWKRLAIAPGLDVNGFHPDGQRLLLTDPSRRTLRLIDIERGEEIWSHAFEVVPGAVIWRGDEGLFAFGANDHRIYVWDTTNDRLQSVLEGHQNSVVRLQFTHSGNLLITSSWDGSMRVWDPIRGTLLLTVPGGLYQISPDDRRAVLREDNNHLRVWELADGRECRALHHGMVGNRTPRPDNWGPHVLDFSPDGRLLASSDVDGIQFWDPFNGTPVAHPPLEVGMAALFSADGSHLLTRSSPDEMPQLVSLQATGDRLRIGRPHPLGAREGLYSGHYSWDGTGRYVAVDDITRTQAVVLDIVKLLEVVRLGPHDRLNQCPISPDGRWVATATWKGQDVKVWEVATGRLVWRLPCDSAFVKFSPDGRWLAVARFPGRECRLWHVGSWRPGPEVAVSTSFLTMAFTRDGRLFAIDDGGRVRLVETVSGREIATLDTGTGSSTAFFCMAFSPDGTRLAAGRDHVIHLWDLRRIREQLVTMGLDWTSPPYPATVRQAALGSMTIDWSRDHVQAEESPPGNFQD